MSSRRVKIVDPNCGTNAIGATLRIFATSGYGSAQKAATSMSKCGALDMAFPVEVFILLSITGFERRAPVGGIDWREPKKAFFRRYSPPRGILRGARSPRP